MNKNDGMISCTLGCWLVAALGGVVAAVLLLVLGENWTFLQAAFMGIVVTAIAGLLLSWLICRPLPALGEAGPVDPADTSLARAKAKREAPAAAKPAAATAAPAPKTAAPAPAAADPAPAEAEVKPSTTLPGEEELAARKGTWSYEKDGAGSGAPAAEPAPEPEPAPAPTSKPSEPVADPVAEAAAAVPAGEEKKPETQSAARDGGPDDLKMIKGVGPKLEALLHSLGFFHFDQVASWKAEEVAWVDQNLQGFKGRVSRDKWVAQAKTLAAGGTTEFSSKVKKGGVYD